MVICARARQYLHSPATWEISTARSSCCRAWCQTVIDLAKQEGLTTRGHDIDLYDAYNADEAFLRPTSLCICPVTE
jgi:hypothetical protein